MSLIGDALRKARQEAAERESDRNGILFSAKIADSPSRSNLGLGLALGALIAVIATVAGGAAVWWVLGIGDTAQDQPAAETTAAIVEPASESAPASVSESSGSDSESGSGRDSDSEQPQRPAAGADPRATSDPASVSASDPDAMPVPVSDHSEQGQRPAAVTAPASAPESNPMTESGFIGEEDGEEIYILEADLGSVQLSLDFLVFRTDDPFTEINGVELHVGGVIEGFRVKSIERDRVRLSNGRRTIVLRAP